MGVVALLALVAVVSAGACVTGPGANDAGPAAVSPGSVSGSVEGRAFDTVAASYLVGKPDDAVQTTVIYVFGGAVACSEITATGWDQTVTNSTQSLEMKLIGKTAGDYPIPANGRVSTGQADVNYTVTATSGTPVEVHAVSGTVTLSSITASDGAAGTFDLTFQNGTIHGDFTSSFCADAHEP